MAKFCGKCGSRLDPKTGLCPQCDAEKMKSANHLVPLERVSDDQHGMQSKAQAPQVAQTTDDIGTQSENTDIQESIQPEKKKNQKRRRMFPRLLAVLAVAVLFIAGTVVTASYLGVLDFPFLPSVKKVTVIFDCCALEEETDFEPESQLLKLNETVSCPSFPTRDGYVFDGWYVDRACLKKYDFDSPVQENMTLYAGWIQEDSEEAQLTENDVVVFYDCYYAVAEIAAQFTDENGFVRNEAESTSALNAVEDYLSELLKEGRISYYERSNFSIHIEFPSGLTCLYYTAQEGTSSAVNTVAIEPFKKNENKAFDFKKDIWNPVPSMLANEISASLTLSEHKITVFEPDTTAYSSLKDFFPDDADIVLWDGHGLYDSKYGSVLLTSEKLPNYHFLEAFDDSDWMEKSDWILMNNAKKGEYTFSFRKDEGLYVSITPQFVEDNLTLDHALVYLSACHSGEDNRLAKAFITAGADVVFYNLGQDPISTGYTEAMMVQIIRYMSGDGEIIENGSITADADGIFHSALDALFLAEKWMSITLNEMGIPSKGYSFFYYSFENSEVKNGEIVFDEKAGDLMTADKKGFVKYHDARPDIFANGNQDYTICSGINGNICSTDGSVDISQIAVKLVGGMVLEDIEDSKEFYFNQLDEGTYEIDIYYHGEVIKHLNFIDVKRHRFTDLGTIDLSKGSMLTINPTNRLGETIPNAEINIEGDDKVYHALLQMDDFMVSASEANIFYCTEVPNGTYQLTIEAEGYDTLEATIKVKKDETLEYQLNPAGEFYGIVIDKETKKALKGVKVSCLENSTGKQFETLTNTSGQYKFDDLDGGEYTVSFSKDTYQPYSMTVSITPAEAVVMLDDIELSPDDRSIVLVLDTSGSMSGSPSYETQNAAIQFVQTVLNHNASVGIVTYSGSASVVSEFSTNKNQLISCIQSIGASGETNIESALNTADSMFSGSSAEKKLIVLMSDGLPNRGKDGDALVSYANSLKSSGDTIYTVGFFEKLGNDKAEAQQLMERLASDGCHYEVSDINELLYFFGDVADQISGQKYIYIRVACPVDVTVSYDGEILTSKPNQQSTRTSFGSLTFEASDEAGTNLQDSTVKVIRLRDGVDYDLKIEGNGNGSMNYTIGFMDDNGDFTDMRRFRNIEIGKNTVIDTVAGRGRTSTLNVDEDGDGRYDATYRANANSRGERSGGVGVYIISGIALVPLTIIIGHRMIKKRR